MAALNRAFTPSRLRFARSRAGLTRSRLAQEVGITPRMLAYYEDGTHLPSEETLNRLAMALNVPASFFGASDIEEIPTEAASFRALSKMSAGRRDAALA